MADITKYLTVRQAAEVLGCTEGRIRQLIAAKSLEAEKFAGVWLILKNDLDRFAEPAKVGRPRKTTTRP